ncbi:MAG: hypothetical protein KatS3mg097_067 [Candidatus Parcubacteria bacterium]|nr:MAG: hypothetical protein KatS3mg097_067 [Candidatus Parcubacteria bacterium]
MKSISQDLHKIKKDLFIIKTSKILSNIKIPRLFCRGIFVSR